MYNIPFCFEYYDKECIILENLYSLTYRDENFFSIVLADENHPVFKAHFPSHPILPGFILLDITAAILNVEVISIIKTKFLLPIEPNSILDFYIKKKDNIIKIIVKNNEQKVADIAYEKR